MIRVLLALFATLALSASASAQQCGPAQVRAVQPTRLASNVAGNATVRTFTPIRNLHDRFQNRRGLFPGLRARCR